MTSKAKYEIDPDDGLKRELVGKWCEEKHARLRHYIDITRSTRQRYGGNRPSFIDLYCATGRARIRDEIPHRIVDGSSLIAATAHAPPQGFTDLFIGDLEEEHVRICESRLRTRSVVQHIHAIPGAADDTAKEVVRKINEWGLHLAFLDPFGLDALPFTVLETLATVRRMDMIIHISENALQRNVIGKGEYLRLDRFSPGWQDFVDPKQPAHVVKSQVLRHWTSKVETLGYKVSDNVMRVTGNKNQPLYWLVLASRHEIADKFWNEGAKASPQRALF